MRSSAWMTAVLLCVIALAGCTPYMMKSSAVDQYPSAEQELDFMAAVERMPAVTNNDAIHGLLLLQDGQDPNKDFPSRVEAGAFAGGFPWGRPSWRTRPRRSAGWRRPAAW